MTTVKPSSLKRFLDGKIIELWEESADLTAFGAEKDAFGEINLKLELYQEMREHFLGERLETPADSDGEFSEEDEEEDEPKKRYPKNKT